MLEKQSIELFKEAEQKVNTKLDPGYIALSLSTNGKFNFDSTIAIRNFDIAELLEISTSIESEKLLYLVNNLSNIIQGGKDAKYLLETEANEILLTLIANFYSPVLTNFPYILDEKEEEILKKDKKQYKDYLELKKNGKEKFTVDIPINKIHIKKINDKIKEPLVLTDEKGFEISFRLPRIGDILIVNDYINKKYKGEDEKHFKLSKKIQGKGWDSLTMEEQHSYRKYITSRASDSIIYTVKLVLLSVGTKKLTNLEDKIKIKIPLNSFKFISDFLQKNSFGIQEEVKVISPIDGKEVERRFQFRSIELIDRLETPSNDNKFTLSFG